MNKNTKKSAISGLVILLTMSSVLFLFMDYNENHANENISNSNQAIKPEVSGQVYQDIEWIDNSGFTPTISPWLNATEEDYSDLNATYDGSYANYDILGESGSFNSLDYDPTINFSGEWKSLENPELQILPQDDNQVEQYGIDEEGYWASHYWITNDAETFQRASVLWSRNYTLPTNLADYSITSAYIGAIVNATGVSLETQVDEAQSPDLYQTGDSAKFFVKVSDPDRIEDYEIAFNRTGPLDNGNMYDSLTESIPESVLIAFLESIFTRTNNTLTLTLGLTVDFERNRQIDTDEWEKLLIKDFEFNFTYEKNMDRYSSVEWYQIGDKIPTEIGGNNIQIDEGLLTFDYTISKNWSELRSPNSELQVLLNNSKYTTGIKLSSMTTASQEAQFDVTTLVQKGVNISTHIKLVLLDNFVLNETFRVSIDNVSLLITYSEVGLETQSKYSLLLNNENRTLSPIKEVPLGEDLNISFRYQVESTNNFIEDAIVKISYQGSIKNLTEYTAIQYYNITINTGNMTLGENYITLTASKEGVENQEITITVDIIQRQTYADIYVDGNKTDTFEYFDTAIGTYLNFTVYYRDQIIRENIENASIELRLGSTSLGFFENKSTPSRYFFNISTDAIGSGVRIITVIAEKDNYTSILENINLVIGQRATTLTVKLNGTIISQNHNFVMDLDQYLNVTAYFNDFDSGDPLMTGNVSLLGYDNLTKDFDLNHYSLIISSNDLAQGYTFFTVLAQLENYEPQVLDFIVEVKQKTTGIKLFFNGTETTDTPSKTLTVGDFLNVSATYFDNSSKEFIENATVELLGDYTAELDQNKITENYSIIIDTKDLPSAVNFITLYAHKVNHDPKTIRMIIQVESRNTSLQVFLNGTDETTDLFMNVTYGQHVNVTARYYDLECDPDSLIDGAIITYKTDQEDIIIKQAETYIEYTLIVNSTNLRLGTNYFSLEAKKTNYITRTISNINIFVQERDTDIELYLNNETHTIDRYLEVIYGKTVNITVFFIDRETIPNSLISGATLTLKNGTTERSIDEHISIIQYSIFLDSSELEIGNNFFTVVAILSNYERQTITNININVLERETELKLFINGQDKTIDPSYDVAIGESITITVEYYDTLSSTKISGAIVNLTGDVDTDLNENLSNQYIYNLDTETLGIGINILNVEATNDPIYLQSSLKIRINIRRVKTEISTESGDVVFNKKPGESLTVLIKIEDKDFGGLVSHATVTYTSNIVNDELREGTLEEVNPGEYQLTLENLPEGSFTIIISVTFQDADKLEKYDVSQFEITINVVRPEEDILLFQILTVVAISAAIGLGGYLIAYQKVLKYPKPVRKAHKIKKMLKKGNIKNISIPDRRSSFEDIYDEELKERLKALKSKVKNIGDISEESTNTIEKAAKHKDMDKSKPSNSIKK